MATPARGSVGSGVDLDKFVVQEMQPCVNDAVTCVCRDGAVGWIRGREGISPCVLLFSSIYCLAALSCAFTVSL